MPACRTSTRSRPTSKTSPGSTSRTAPRSPCIPPTGISACGGPTISSIRRPGSKTELVARLAGRPGRRRRADRSQADAGAMEQRAPCRRQRLLHLGDREEARARRLVDGDQRRQAGAAEGAASRRRLLRARSHRAGSVRPIRRDEDVVLRARLRLHGVGALRPQPHRPRRRQAALQAGRHRAHHDSVAVGARDRARDDRARRHPLATAVRS